MKKFMIRDMGREETESYRIEAEDYLQAIEILRGYGQYRKNVYHRIYEVTTEEFSTMTREDYYYITEF